MPACRIPAASAAAALACTLLLVLLAGAVPASAATSTQPAATEPLRLPTVAPPELIALTERMEQVAVTSQRSSLRLALVVTGNSKEAQLLRLLSPLFDYTISGEFQATPPEATYTAQLLGRKIHFITVGGHYYMYLGVRLAHRDHGRPWVDLGPNGLGALIGAGSSSTEPAPTTKPAHPSEAPYEYRRLARLLRSPESVTTLGAGVIDGEPVVGFREEIAESAFSEGGEVKGLGGAFSAAAHRPPIVAVPAPVAVPVDAEVFIAADGRPVRIHLDVHEESAEEAVLVDNYAIDFPLHVTAPPASETITLAELKRRGLLKRVSTSTTTTTTTTGRG